MTLGEIAMSLYGGFISLLLEDFDLVNQSLQLRLGN